MSTSFHKRKRREHYVLQKSPGMAEKAGVHMPPGTPWNSLERRPCTLVNGASGYSKPRTTIAGTGTHYPRTACLALYM